MTTQKKNKKLNSIFSQIINGKYVEGFYIYARQLEAPTTESSYKMLTVLNGGASSTCSVTGLQTFTSYEFFLVPFYKTVEGKPSNSRAATTMEDGKLILFTIFFTFSYLFWATRVQFLFQKCPFLFACTVPSEPPTHMEAMLLNATAVYLKWRAPPLDSQKGWCRLSLWIGVYEYVCNLFCFVFVFIGVIKSFYVVVRGMDATANKSRVLTNVTVDVSTPTLLLANLTEGVTYSVSIAAANAAGIGPYSPAATLRLDPVTKRLDQSSTQRFPLNHNNFDDFLTKPWFIVLLGLALTVVMLSFGAMVFFKRKHMMMQQGTITAMRGMLFVLVDTPLDKIYTAILNERSQFGEQTTHYMCIRGCMRLRIPFKARTCFVCLYFPGDVSRN